MKEETMNKTKFHIILASNSPRRRELLAGLDVDFEVKVLPGVVENFPVELPTGEVASYIAGEKAEAYKDLLSEDDLVITADTVVIVDETVLGKPHDEDDARRMLHTLSNKTHQVVTGVCLTTRSCQHSFSVSTSVTFKELTEQEIDYYIARYQPFDKAGAYGIQEWIGYIGVVSIEGSYFNVMGLPVQRIWEEIEKL